MRITLIAGARPNFMKIGPIVHAIEAAISKGASISYRLIHTGQHYDEKLSDSFFKDLNIPEPHSNLGVGSGTQAEQTGNIMIAFEKELINHPTDVVLVVGDVNSTMACSIVAKKEKVQVVHVEAGIRSFDLDMPEEINRMVTDAITDHFFTTTKEAGDNLLHAGIKPTQIHLVGNTMIDSLVGNLHRIVRPLLFDELQLKEKEYFVTTLHRPSNVDDPENLQRLLLLISEGADGKPVLFPVHPRTRKNLSSLSIPSNIHLLDPMRYLEFMYLIKNAAAVITDSGGVQEETTYLGIPCMTLRENTERPETVTLGTNDLIGLNPDNIRRGFDNLRLGTWKKGQIPPFWDGQTSGRIVEKLIELYIERVTCKIK